MGPGRRRPDRRAQRPHGFYGLRDDRAVTADSHRELCRAVEQHHNGLRSPGTWAISSRTTSQIVHDVFVSETGSGSARSRSWSARPTRSDGALDLAALVERLRGYGVHQVGPLDLFVALTRLGPTDPAS